MLRVVIPITLSNFMRSVIILSVIMLIVMVPESLPQMLSERKEQGTMTQGERTVLRGATTFCRLVILSTCHFVNLLFCQLAILSTCHFVDLSFCQLVIFVDFSFCQLVISSTCHFINLSFCSLVFLSTEHLINLLFSQLTSLFWVGNSFIC
jgi:hypothetical protein